MLEAERFTMVASTGGRLELVAIAYLDSTSPKAIWHATQTPQQGEREWWGIWTSWRSLGRPDGQLMSDTEPTAAVNADGRLEVAVVGSEVFHAWQRPEGDWSGWQSLGRPRDLGPGSLLGGSALASNEDGRLELFTKALDSDGTLWHRWQAEPGRGPWREWDSLGLPPGTTGFGLHEAPPVLASNLDSRLELFVLANDGAVWHRWQKVPNGGWSSWESLETPSASLDQEPTVVRNHDGRLELFTRDTDGTVWHRWQTKPGRGPWASWASLGSVAGSVSGVVAGTQSDGRLLLFAITSLEGDLQMWQQEQTARNNGWLPEWRLQGRAKQAFPDMPPPSSSSLTGLSPPVMASENAKGRPLLCSIASGTGHLTRRTPLLLAGRLAHIDDQMTLGMSFLDRPPDELPTFSPHPA